MQVRCYKTIIRQNNDYRFGAANIELLIVKFLLHRYFESPVIQSVDKLIVSSTVRFFMSSSILGFNEEQVANRTEMVLGSISGN